ncbi:hypothetical protein ACLMJK_006571 [Lecanora helva]
MHNADDWYQDVVECGIAEEIPQQDGENTLTETQDSHSDDDDEETDNSDEGTDDEALQQEGEQIAAAESTPSEAEGENEEDDHIQMVTSWIERSAEQMRARLAQAHDIQPPSE